MPVVRIRPRERDQQQTDALADFVMTEIDLPNRSDFRWCDLFDTPGERAMQPAGGWQPD